MLPLVRRYLRRLLGSTSATTSADGGRSLPARRCVIVLASIIVPLVLAALVGIVLTSGGSVHDVAVKSGLAQDQVQHESATVTKTQSQQCQATSEDMSTSDASATSVPCLKVWAKVTSGTDSGHTVSFYASDGMKAKDLPNGTKIIVERYPGSNGEPATWAWSDYARGVPLAALTLLFVVVIALVAKWRGIKALLGLAFAFVMIWIYVLPALITGQNAAVVALCAGVVVMTAVLYLAHGMSLRTSVALLGTIVGMLLVTLIGMIAISTAHLWFVNSDDDFQLAKALGDSGVNALHGVFLAGVVLAGLGVLNDVTITQASAVWELRAANPSLSRRQLFAGGMRIGRDHIASTIYTIAFAYAGASLPVLMLLELYQLPIMRSLTSGTFALEIVRTLAGAIGLVLAIPLTTAIGAWIARIVPADVLEGDLEHSHAEVGTIAAAAPDDVVSAPITAEQERAVSTTPRTPDTAASQDRDDRVQPVSPRPVTAGRPADEPQGVHVYPTIPVNMAPIGEIPVHSSAPGGDHRATEDVAPHFAPAPETDPAASRPRRPRRH